MGVYVLSERPVNNHVGWAACYDLESTLKDAFCDATILHPIENQHIELFNLCKIPTERLGALKRYNHRLFKSWFKLEQPPILDEGPNILLVIGMSGGFLLSLFALGSLLKQFDYRIAYLLDGFEPSSIDRDVIPLLDHLFVTSSELADEIRSSTSLKVDFLPLAINTFRFEPAFNKERPIDIINYGRSDLEVHQQLQKYFNSSKSNRLYLYSTFNQPGVYNLQEHFELLYRLLGCSKISLCFEASKLKRFRGQSPLLYRWFEAWASGCTVVGRKPFGQGVSDLMDWDNSAINLPANSSQCLPFLEELLNDKTFLLRNAERNYRECVLRHDWRYRIKAMFETVGLPIPDRLNHQILDLKKKFSAPVGVLDPVSVLGREIAKANRASKVFATDKQGNHTIVKLERLGKADDFAGQSSDWHS